jgi:hypothetical protein
VTPGGTRPETVGVLSEGNVITAWPTKLALVPYLAERVLERFGSIGAESDESSEETAICAAWPRPQVALLPWETPRAWVTTSELSDVRRRNAA